MQFLRFHQASQPQLAWLLGLGFIACSGNLQAPGAGNDDDGGGGGGLAPPSENSLRRNPEKPLTCADPKALNVGETPLLRLTNVEYQNTLADLLAPLDQPARRDLPIEVFTDGFSNNWEGQNPSAPLIEQFAAGAGELGPLVAKNLAQLGASACPGSGDDGQARCFDSFLDSFAKRAFRRPLFDDEKDRLRGFFTQAKQAHGFDKAMEMVADIVVQSPQFLYKVEFGEGDASKQAVKLGGYELASRLSYLLWDTMPDEALFAAAEAGELSSTQGLMEQVERMLAHPKAEGAINEFANQWLRMSRVAGHASAERKNKMLFPNYTAEVASGLLDGLGQFLADAFLGEGGGLKKLLTSEKAWVNDKTAWVYDLQGVQGSALSQVTLDKEQRRGLLTQGGLLAGLAHDANQAAVLRGVFVLESLLCQPPPPPPMGMIPDAPDPDPNVVRTTRQRLVEEHEAQGGACRSCHEVIDGVGFAFENYDAVGKWQTKEFGLPIDSSALIDGTFDADGEFANAVEMTEKLARSEQVYQCFVDQFYRYALARRTQEVDGCNIAAVTDQVVKDEGDFRSLVKALAKSNAFRYRSQFAQ